MNVKNRQFKLIVIFLFIYFFSGLGWTEISTANDTYNSAEEVTATVMECLKSNDFENAVSLFHFPPSYSKDELNNEVIGIKSMLQLFRNEFGSIKQISLNKSPAYYYTVSVGSGDLTYWKRYPSSIKTEFRVVFDKVGEGFISVEACKISSYWEIRNISYGLNVNAPNSKNIITGIARKAMSLMEKQSKSKTNGRDKGI